jgi:hypothetical protein
VTPWDWIQLLATLPLIVVVGLLGLAVEIADMLTPEEPA